MQNEIWKARFVVQGHRYNIKKSLVHDFSVVIQHSMKLTVGLASILDFRLFSSAVMQAYIQSREPLIRNVYINPPKYLELSPSQLIKTSKPLYGLVDRGGYWGRTLKRHILNDLGMNAAILDEAIHFA